jgi:hypothetical protein
LGFYSVLVSPDLYIAGDFVTKWLDFYSETDRSKPAEWSKSVLAEAAIPLKLFSMKNFTEKKSLEISHQSVARPLATVLFLIQLISVDLHPQPRLPA